MSSDDLSIPRKIVAAAAGRQRFRLWPRFECWQRSTIVGLFAIVLLVLFFAVRDLPMVDLPQHAALLTIWDKLGSPDYQRQFELNLHTPYLLSYFVAHGVSHCMSVTSALKVVIWLAVVGQVPALMFLCRQWGHDGWVALLGVPLALGYCFLFGFVSYIVAVPFLFIALGLATKHANGPTFVSGLLLALDLVALFCAHGVAFAQAVMCILPLLVLGKGALVARLAPLFLALAMAAFWFLPGPATTRMGSDLWGADVRRLIELPSQLVGAGSGDRFATVYGLLLLVVVGQYSGRLSADGARLIPLLLVLVGLVAFPVSYRGYVLIGPRFGTLVLPAVLLACKPKVKIAKVARLGPHLQVTLLAAVGIAVFALRTVSFNNEAASFHEVAQRLPAGLRIRPVVFDPEPRAFPDLPALAHLPAYYFVEKGGMQGYSFAIYPTSVIRYRAGHSAKMKSGEEWRPLEFRVDEELLDYDCFLVHSTPAHARALFAPHSDVLKLVAAKRDWFAYCSSQVAQRLPAIRSTTGSPASLSP